MRDFIDSLTIPEAEKHRLLALTPGTYLGLAPQLALRRPSET
jgi:adenylosuccinate lyase